MIDIDFTLGDSQADVDKRLVEWADADAVSRLWDRDVTLWSTDPDTPELADRLGWLDLPQTSESLLDSLRSLRSGIPFWMTDLVLLGMGGSSLAPEVFAGTVAGEGLPLTLLDTTHPAAVLDLDWVNPANSVFIIASKSGTTLETLSLFRHFWSRTQEVVEDPGTHFIAITDPGSSLAELASERGFRAVFEAPPDVGGRFSALSPFGLVPAALMGTDIASILATAVEAADACRDEVGHNPGFRLGAALGALAGAGRDKLTFVASRTWAAFPAWGEQLVAESTGKNDVGIVPITHEPIYGPERYGDDRVFVGLLTSGDTAREAEQWGDQDEAPAHLDALEAAGHPVIRIRLEQPEELGALFFVWEVAVAMAGSALGIHPFNQPDVQIAKEMARQAMTGEEISGDANDANAIDLLWERPPYGHAPSSAGAEPDLEDIRARLDELLDSVEPGDYIGIHAYLRGGDEAEEELLTELRTALTEATGAATTLGYGPRFLHSTGQLHKGGANNGVFLQLVDDGAAHLHVPESDFTFRQLIRAQARGDLGALAQRERRTLRVRVGDPDGVGLRRLIQLVEESGEEAS